MIIRYFAWLQDHTGCSQEQITCPPEVTTIETLTSYLRSQSAGHEAALSQTKMIRVARNHEFASFDEPVQDNDEIAFFPPVTGG
ncbi:MAG: molybdopterin converting factor subunit 1 [Candidatus Puniceispirillaceae bacterium]